MTGYLIEYKKKTSFLYRDEPGDNFTEKRKALVSREILAQMLSTYRFIIFVAYLVDVEQYRDNCEDVIEVITEV
ncbi:MAG TPA: hypothetical protein H9782_07235 [Candidatus Bariatricus faecipullorum]|uniref:hypothetical protein n=1 Tax=Eubacterium sp. ER2 TaxID=1519438 RepID=UPI00051C22CD|nr:hypothetical protein [Eubacterium sp. ER2]HJB19036.1 hypothetical protein [Candidatus Bariatricus faecipullorum]